jgi:nucleoside 2-deoxyribosyltransferase
VKLYLAAPYAARDYIRSTVAPRLEAVGHTMTSEWLLSTNAITPDHLGTSPAKDAATVMHHAGKDLAEVAAADVLVHFTAAYLCRVTTLDSVRHQLHSGGRHVETGYALALNKSVIVVGDPENIFQRGLCHTARHMFDVIGILADMVEHNPDPWPSNEG